MSDIKYEIVKKIGVLSKAGSGWTKELNIIRWNDREPKYDLRDWSLDGAKMGKGVTSSKEELLNKLNCSFHRKLANGAAGAYHRVRA